MEDLELNIFDEDVETQEQEIIENNDNPENKENKENNKTTDVDPESIFNDDEDSSQEGVSSDEDSKNKGDSTSQKSGSSPKNTYSSIAAALKEDGVLLNLEDDDVNNINTPDDFAEAIEKEVTKRLDDSQRRMKEALDYGVQPEEVTQYERTINYLNTLDEDIISSEDEQGETLRRQLIFQDYVNRGFSQERAKKEMEKSFSAGTDVEDAKEALESNKEFFIDSYNKTIQEAKKESENEKKLIQKQAEDLKKAILNTEKPYEGISLSKDRRQKIYDSITKVVDKTADGRGLNAIQKYEQENPIEYKQKLATLFELTDGFKNLDVLISGKANKQTRKSLRELDHVLRNTPTYADGRLKLANGSEDAEAYQGLRLDI